MTTVAKVAGLVRQHLTGEGSGHDWEHIERVWKTAQKLAKDENADLELVELAALLHDVDDAKLTGDLATEDTLPTAHAFMAQAGVAAARQAEVAAIIRTLGFRKTLEKDQEAKSLEARVCADADYLDGLGAIGIARTFTYGGSKGRPIFKPAELPREVLSSADYVARDYSTLPHFFEKLLKLRSQMATTTGKKEAAKRHARIVRFLEDFFEETAAPVEWLDLLEPFR